MMSPLANSSTKTRTEKPSLDIQEQVRRRAFELYERRGREDGHELDDWLQAESELARPKTKAAAMMKLVDYGG